MALTKAQKIIAKKNLDYWTKRELEQLKHNIKDEKEFDKRIEEIHKNMLINIQNEIDAFYGRYASKEGITIAEAKKRVSSLDIERYEKKAKRYVAEKNFSKEANEEMRLYNLTMKVNRLELLKANIGLELISGTDELEKFMGQILQGRTLDELKRQAGILGKTVQDNAKLAKTIPNASFHNATFSQRIWNNQTLLRAEIDKLLQVGMIQGKNPRVLARELRKKFNVGVYNSERLMRTELARVQTEAQRRAFIENGYEEYTFHALGDACSICKEKNGKHFKVDDMMPAKNAPPMHPHCRCSTSAYEDSADFEAWLDYLDKGGTTEEWNRLKGKATEPEKPKKVERPKFQGAKTIQEAENYAKKFVKTGGFSIGKKNINYSGLTIEQANKINEELDALFEMYDIDRFSSIETFGKTQKKYWEQHAEAPMATTNFGNLMINKELCKSPKTIGKYIEEGKKAFSIVVENIGKLTGKKRQLAETYKNAGRSLVGETFEDMILHETGHHISYMQKYNKEISAVIKSSDWESFAKGLSGYANHSSGEYIAESWVAYNKGELDKLDPKLVEIFEKVKR